MKNIESRIGKRGSFQIKDRKLQSGIHKKNNTTDEKTESRLAEKADKVLYLEHTSDQRHGL